MRKLYIRFNSMAHRERGIALLFALAILALLLVMALAFATNSIFDQRTATNAANIGSARMLAQSGLSRVIAVLRAYGDTAGYDVQFSFDGNSTWPPLTTPARWDSLNRLSSKSNNTSIYAWNNTHKVAWEYITVNDGITDRIIGRYAYVVMPVAGIDPGMIVKKEVDEALDAEERYGVNVDEINVMSVSPADINAALAGGFNYTAAAVLPAVQPNPGYYTGAWGAYSTLFAPNPVGLNITSPEMQAKFMKWFVLDSPANDEKYWIDLNTDNVQAADGSEFFHRFNLARTDWNAFITSASDMYEKILLDADHDGIPDFNPAAPPAAMPFVTPGISDGYGIPWLAFFGYRADGTAYTGADLAELQGTFSSVVNRRRQIAANLVEYCRPAITAVASHPAISDSADWFTTAPNFVGNVKTPYINEVGLQVAADVSIDYDTSIPPKAKVKVDFQGRAMAELINIYEAAYAIQDLDLKVTGISVTLNINVGGTDYPFIISGDATFDGASRFPTGDWLNGYSAIKIATFSAGGSFDGTGYTIDSSNPNNYKTNVTIRSVSIDRAVLYKSGDVVQCYDFSQFPAKLGLNGLVAQDVTVSTFGLGTCVTFETYDPRQNINRGDWSFIIKDLTFNADGVMTIGGGFGRCNTNSNPAAATAPCDIESATDPAAGNMSTAFIRNGVMLSPWELGFIHRGAAWQTINLKEYDVNKAVAYVNVGGVHIIPGGGKYTDHANGGGDANILNQIKMGDATQKHKININANYLDPNINKNVVLNALFSKIRIGSNPLTPAAGVDAINPAGTSVSSLSSAVMNRVNNVNYLTRAEVVNAKTSVTATTFALSNGTCGFAQDSDAKQEELIGKFINLTDVGARSDYFTVIILAQAIKDIGSPSTAAAGTGIDVIKRDKDGDIFSFDTPNTSTPVWPHTFKTRLGVFDAVDTNDYRVDGSKIYLYADEIVGEQKIKALVHRRAPGFYDILSFEFLE